MEKGILDQPVHEDNPNNENFELANMVALYTLERKHHFPFLDSEYARCLFFSTKMCFVDSVRVDG